MLGIASIFSLGQTNNVWGYSNECTKTDPGTFCKIGVKYDCRAGCYCVGGTRYGVGSIIVDEICNQTTEPTTAQLQTLHSAGVFLCKDYDSSKPYSSAGAKSPSDCKGVDTSSDCTDAPGEGKYCKEKGSVKQKCKEGCYCPGGVLTAVGKDYKVTTYCKNKTGRGGNEEAHLNASGIYYCPDEFPDSDEGKKNATFCYKKVNDIKLYNRWKNCSAGTYLPKNIPHNGSCAVCPVDCNCPGGDWHVSTTDDQGIFDCPGHPDSDSGQNDSPTPPVNPSVVPFFHRTEIDPYSLHAEMYCASGKIPCVAGSYLPAGGDSTDDCELCEPGFYCLAGCHTPNSNKDQTPKKCPVSKPNSAEGSDSVSDCYASGTTPPNPTNIRCDAGYYLPSGADSEDDCEWCEAGYMCPGNNLKYKCGPRGYSEGGASQCSPCPDGQMADNANKSCEDGLIEVQAGYYLKAGTIIPEPCPSTDKFCPGGRWKKSGVDQGAFKCPFDSRLDGEVSSDHQSCIIKLTPAQMVYGVDASRDGCFGYTNATNYQQCVWGDISFEVVNDTGTVYNASGSVNGNVNSNVNSAETRYVNDKLENSKLTDFFEVADDMPSGKRKQVDDTTSTEKDVANKYDVPYVPKEPLKTEKVTGSSTQPTQLLNVTKISGSNSTVATVPVAARSARAPRTTRVQQPRRGAVKR